MPKRKLFIEQGDGNYCHLFEFEVEPTSPIDEVHISYGGDPNKPYQVLTLPKSIWDDFVRHCQAQET